MAEPFKFLSIGDLMAMEFPDTRGIEAALKTYAASNLDASPRYNHTGEVHHCQGEALSPIIWQGRQWAVTEYGLEQVNGTYAIEKTRLWENEKKYGWVRQIFHKTWADPTDFAEALRIARYTHRAVLNAKT
jgi:hypothetical protein